MSEALALINAERDRFAAVCSDPSIEFEREASFAMQVLSGSEYLMSVAMRNKASLQAAIVNVAAIGISLNPAAKLAYLVPRKNQICLDISYMGMMHLAQQTGAIVWGQALVVRQQDTFELRGIDQPPIHKFNPFAEDRGEVIGVYVVVKCDNGDYLTHAMPISKVFEIRDRSEAWKAYQKNGTKCPWVTDEEEMVKKTCVKQAAKYWPRRDRLDNAIHHMNVEGEEGLQSINEEKDVTDEGRVLPPRESAKTIAASLMESIDVDTQKVLREIAEDVKALMGNPEEAYLFLQEQTNTNQIEDAAHKGALWGLFNSRERSSMIKARDTLKQEGKL
jgi:recombination protein RecT